MVCVCNYSRKPYEFKADGFLGLAEPVSHVTGADDILPYSYSIQHGTDYKTGLCLCFCVSVSKGHTQCDVSQSVQELDGK